MAADAGGASGLQSKASGPARLHSALASMSTDHPHPCRIPKSPRKPFFAGTACVFLGLVFWVSQRPDVDTSGWPEKMWMVHWDNHRFELYAMDVFVLLSLMLFSVATYRVVQTRRKHVST